MDDDAPWVDLDSGLPCLLGRGGFRTDVTAGGAVLSPVAVMGAATGEAMIMRMFVAGGTGVPQSHRCRHHRRRSDPGQRMTTASGGAREREGADAPSYAADRLLAGAVAMIMMTGGRGFSNAEAKRELGSQLRYPSWCAGFKAEPA